jgi:hypothetical protein
MERTVFISGTPASVDVSMVDCALLGAHIVKQESAAAIRNAEKRTYPVMPISPRMQASAA